MHSLARLATIATIATIACPLLASGPARADTDPGRLRCVQLDQATGAPGTVELSCEPAPAPESAQPGLDDQTHVFFLPTGNTLRAGEAAFRGHGLFLYDQLAYGVSDNIEITVSAPIVPIFAGAGIRVQILPRTSPLRLLVTAGIWRGFEDSMEELTVASGSGTLAYQTDNVNFHASIGAMKPVRRAPYADAPSNERPVVQASLGAVIRSSERSALFFETGQLTANDGYDDDSMEGVAAGIKLIRSSYDVDLGFLLIFEKDIESPALPFVSADFRF